MEVEKSELRISRIMMAEKVDVLKNSSKECKSEIDISDTNASPPLLIYY